MDKQARIFPVTAKWCAAVTAILWAISFLAADGGVFKLSGAVAFGVTAVLFHLLLRSNP